MKEKAPPVSAGPSLRKVRRIAPRGCRQSGSRAVPRSAGEPLGVLYSFFWPASVVARSTSGSRLNAYDQSEDDGTQLIEHPDPRHETSNDRRADSDGQTDHCDDTGRGGPLPHALRPKDRRQFTEDNGRKLEKAIHQEWTPDKGGLAGF
jgi:hypothetical protein